MPQSPHQVARHITVKYGLSLAFLGVTAIAGFFIMRAQIGTSQFGTHIAGLSGRQRFLLQRSAFLSQYLVRSVTADQRRRIRYDLNSTLDLLEETHFELMGKGSSEQPPPQVLAVYFREPWQLDTRLRDFLRAGRSLARARDADLGWDSSHFQHIGREALTGEIVEALDHVTDGYRQHSETKLEQLQYLAVATSASTIVLLLVSAVFIFQPLVRQVEHEMKTLSTLNDTLEQRVAERTAEAERRANSLSEKNLVLENAVEGICRLNSHGICLSANETYTRMLGLDTNQVVQSSWLDHIHAPDRQRASRAFERVQTEGRVRFEARLRGAQQQHAVAEFVLLRAGIHSNVPAFYLFAADVTDRKNAQERMLRAERLAAIGEMVAGVAHESRNAMQQIQASTRTLHWRLEDRSDTSEAMELIADIERSHDRLLRLFDDLRGYAAPLQPDFRPVDVKAIVSRAWTSLEPTEIGHLAKHEITGSNLSIEADPFQLEQVFRNVLENALTAGTDAVTIQTTIDPTQIAGEPAVQIRIRDNGSGFSPDALNHVFDAFFTTKTEGTGLGMAIVKRIIDAHRGKIVACNYSAGGAEITITLPMEQT